MISHTFPTGLEVTVDIPRPRPTGNRKQRKRQRQRWAEKDRLLLNTVHDRVFHNGLPAELASSVGVTVGMKYRSQVSVSASGMRGYVRSISARIYLHAASNGTSHAIIGHEVSHVRGYAALYFKWAEDWKPYLDLRFPNGEPRLDTEYVWDRDEILAEDLRLLFASDECRSEWPSHMLDNAIPDPRQVAGLREFLSEWGREKVSAA